MTDLLPFLITGLVTGSLYGLAGLGLVLTYRTSGVFNFGHGAIGAAAAFTFYTLHIEHGVAWPVAVAVTLMVFGVVVGFVMERITRGLGDVPEAVVVVATVGILLGTQGALNLIYGPITRNFPDFLPTSGFTISDVSVTWAQVISFAIASGTAVGLYVFLRRNRLGVAMRAVVDNPTLTSLSGERPVRVRSAAWTIGSAFAAMSGILLAPTLGLDAYLLTILVVQAFGACAIGYFSSLPMTYVGGLVVGVTASLATRYFTDQPWSGIPPTVPFLVLIGVLLVVPVRKLPQRRASLRGLVLAPPQLPKSARTVLVVVGGGALLLVPAVVGTKLPVWTSGLTYAVIFASLALLVWTSGQISLCHAAFAALGATGMSHLTSAGVPWLPAVAIAGLLTVPVGALVAIPAIRLSGIYLALATLGFGILMQNVVYPSSLMFGSRLIVTVDRPQFGPIDGSSDEWLYYVVLAIVVFSLAVVVAVGRGRLGRLLRAMSETPTMLSTHGLNVNVTRLIVFCVSAYFAGVGGALAITQTGAASGVGYGPITSLILLAVLAISGTRLLRASIVAAVLLAVVPAYLSSFGVDQQTFGFGFLAIGSALVVAQRATLATWLQRAVATSRVRIERSPVASRSANGTRPHSAQGQGDVAAPVAVGAGRP